MSDITENISQEETLQTDETQNTNIEEDTTSTEQEETTLDESTDTLEDETNEEETTLDESTDTLEDETNEEETTLDESADASEDETNEEETTLNESTDELEIEEDGEETTAETVAETTFFNSGTTFLALSSFQLIISILLIGVVLQQQAKLSNSFSSSGESSMIETDSYWKKNKGRSKEGKLARLTVILAVIFFITTFILGFMQ